METLLNTTVFHFGGTDITGHHLTEAVVVLLASCLIVYLVNRWVASVFHGRGVTNAEDISEYTRSTRILILIVGVTYALHLLGFKLTALFAAGGLFAVVSGLAFKGVLEGYVSGITLKLERNIRRGDVIELDGATGKVRRIGTRSSTVHLFDGSVLVVPNTHLIQTTVRNITF